MDRFEIARALYEIGALLELEGGDSRFRARAYTRAAEALDDVPDLDELIQKKRLTVHSGFEMDEDTMTRRLVRAMRHPAFKIWGHALGRLIERRAPYACRLEEVPDAIAESRAAMEINGDPYRLDPEPRWIRAARARGISFVVSTDARSAMALRNVTFGVMMARRGGLERADVLNTLDAKTFARKVRPAA